MLTSLLSDSSFVWIHQLIKQITQHKGTHSHHNWMSHNKVIQYLHQGKDSFPEAPANSICFGAAVIFLLRCIVPDNSFLVSLKVKAIIYNMTRLTFPLLI